MSEDNTLEFKKKEILSKQLKSLLGENFFVGYTNSDGDLAYYCSEEMDVKDLLLLLESIKMTYFYGIE